MTKINKTCNPKFCAVQQPLEIFNDITTLEEGVNYLLTLAKSSQQRLIELIVTNLVEPGISYYNPGIKGYDSALRKAKSSYGVSNQIRQLTDCYRASIIFDNPDQLNFIQSKTRTMLEENRFQIIYDKNSFEEPWTDGYRDINFKIKDLNNSNLVGELQINQCSVKLFTEFMGHKIYEISRAIDPSIKSKVKPYLNEVTKYGYNKVVKEKETCSDCGKCDKSFGGGRYGIKRKSKKYSKKSTKKYSKKYTRK